ncbi:MOSC domain-containing protein [Bremerella cremea]|uniref:MOSC domain-containing protein n=1 Tax=Bremerella cremea TaxID=1031537 RepID=UPI0031EB620A
MTDDEFLHAFLDCTLKAEDWTHEAHVRAAFLIASRHPWAEAMLAIRAAIQAFNRATKTPESLDRGYHETITQAFMRLIFIATRQTGPHATAQEFLRRHPELSNKEALRQYYSRERLRTWLAKRCFLLPDLQPLPRLEGESMPEHLSTEQLDAGLPQIEQSPCEEGKLEAIVIRPMTDQRESLAFCELSLAGGVHGDNWALGCWMSLPDGSPHPDVQVAIMNSRAIDLIAGDRSRWALAGDNLFVDMNLSKENLPVGQRIAIGEAELEITEVAHNGCGKFSERFGPDATRWVNSKVGKQLHLRGIYARIVKNGLVRVGDTITKI